MTKIYNIELSEDEVLMAQELGLDDFLEDDDNEALRCTAEGCHKLQCAEGEFCKEHIK